MTHRRRRFTTHLIAFQSACTLMFFIILLDARLGARFAKMHLSMRRVAVSLFPFGRQFPQLTVRPPSLWQRPVCRHNLDTSPILSTFRQFCDAMSCAIRPAAAKSDGQITFRPHPKQSSRQAAQYQQRSAVATLSIDELIENQTDHTMLPPLQYHSANSSFALTGLVSEKCNSSIYVMK